MRSFLASRVRRLTGVQFFVLLMLMIPAWVTITAVIATDHGARRRMIFDSHVRP